MKLSKSSKKVSWAPDANLCQAKLFRSKDCPSQVCLKARDGLLAKKSWILHSDGRDTNGLPHGFKDTRVNQSKKKVSHIPKIKWKCPPKFVLSSNWLVASGEESQEAEAQKLRENHVVEAVYPRISAIPLSPSISLDIEECHQDDCDIPLVPITSMEDEGTVDTLFDLAAPINSSMISKPPALSQDLLASGNTSQCNRPVLEPPAIEKTALGLSPDVEADIIAAATAAITMVMRCKEQGSLIDTDLLIKILTNPKMTEKLINDCREPGGTSTIPFSESKPVTQLVTVSCSEPAMVLEPRPANENIPTNGNLHNILKGVQPTLNTTPTLPDILPTSSFKAIKSHVKDVNYYKSLVKQHGGEKQGTQDQIIPQYANHENYLQGMELIQNFKPTELKPKSQKSCIFYNSPTGCRNGTNCPYQHDTFSQLRCGSMLEDKRAKRMKLDGKITGRK
ncbi:unnamed protein product, partial [Vitis vinifera]